MFEFFGVLVAGFAVTFLGLLLVWYRRYPVNLLRDRLVVTPLAWIPEEHLEVGLAAENRTSLEELPGFICLLLLLHEDDLFFIHRGINKREVYYRLRAFLTRRSRLYGGSSITQQLAKHLFYPRRTTGGVRRFWQKLSELMCAFKLERNFTKSEIFSLYVSSVRLGSGQLFGFKAASKVYFKKPPHELHLHEALFLIGMIPAPGSFMSELVYNRNMQAFPIKTALVKCVDLMRLLVLSFGWRSLDSIHTVSFRDVLPVARDMKEYNPQQLPTEFELLLEARAMLAIDKLHALLRQLAERPHPELVRFLNTGKVAST